MIERKKRVRTGCLTCRQRRVKCDERRPICEKCHAANVACSGFQPPRGLPAQTKPAAEELGPKKEVPQVQLPTTNSDVKISPLYGYFGSLLAATKPHRRAFEVLGHQQYVLKTAKLLFSSHQLSFWQGYLVEVAWTAEHVYDAIVSLGVMHQAALLLSDPKQRVLGVNSKIAAFQLYASALNSMTDYYGRNAGPSETSIAALLLLGFFEVS